MENSICNKPLSEVLNLVWCVKILFHVQIHTGDYFIIAVEPGVGEMLQILAVRKSGSFKSVFLAEATVPQWCLLESNIKDLAAS